MKKRAFCLLSSLLTGCAIEPGYQGTPIKPESIGKILLQVSPENLSIGGFARSRELAERIGKNLGGWGYPIVAGQARDYSHLMEAAVGGVEKKSTPTGFSFSMGNSDPRALEFQKADVVTVTCTLKSRERPAMKAYLKEDFVANDLLKSGERSNGNPALFDWYVDHIGTACFNLLSELHVKHTPPAPTEPGGTSSSTGGTSSNWFPEVQVEVRQKPVPAPTPTPESLPAREGIPPSVRTAPASAPETASPPAETAPAPAAENPAPPAKKALPALSPPEALPATGPIPAEPPPIRTETQQGDGRKQIIIHNKGNPVILEFGYERR